MPEADEGQTDPKLLKRVAALWDQPAWCEFFERYSPMVRRWCAGYRLDPASLDELYQRIWVELARRMPAYQYDPTRSFRGWLRTLCRHRAIDLIRELGANSLICLGDFDLIDERRLVTQSTIYDLGGDEMSGTRLRLLHEAHEAQEHVRSKVKPVRWEVFWRVVIQGEPMREVAEALGLKYATAYAGANHVADLLRAEGRRRNTQLTVAKPSKRKEA